MHNQQDGIAPVSASAYYDLKIEDIAREEDVIACIQDLWFFKPGTKVGEKVNIKIEESCVNSQLQSWLKYM